MWVISMEKSLSFDGQHSGPGGQDVIGEDAFTQENGAEELLLDNTCLIRKILPRSLLCAAACRAN